MTRDEIYRECVDKIAKTNCLLMELATGTGKSRLSLMLANHILSFNRFSSNKEINVLILVAKRVHKQTWKEEIEKWGGIKHPTIPINIRMECYESMHKCADKKYDIVIFDEVHHVGSDNRLELLKAISCDYMIGLSATIPKKLKQLFKYRYHADIVSCDIVEAIEDDILPEPTILLFPLMLDNREATETWEINAKAKGPLYYGTIANIWKYKKQKVHAILSCTQKQKLLEYNKLIDWEKSKFMQTRSEALHQSWLFHAGKRLEYLADIKLPIVRDIVKHLSHYRSITFCKTIPQAESVCKHCIHSKNEKSDQTYEDFNAKKINHISAVNILNENANLADCEYGVFCNFSSSEISVVQRQGRLLRHKNPIIVLPYYADTREEELVKTYIEGFTKVKTIHSILEI